MEFGTKEKKTSNQRRANSCKEGEKQLLTFCSYIIPLLSSHVRWEGGNCPSPRGSPKGRRQKDTLAMLETQV